VSILNKLRKNQNKDGKLFGVVAGARLSGKTTIAGTLPGTTLLLQADLQEAGSESALALAKEKGNTLEVVNFSNHYDLLDLLTELYEANEFDNIYIDGISALTEMIYEAPETQALKKKDGFAAFQMIGDTMKNILLKAKKLTLGSSGNPANVFLTMALKPKLDKAGNQVDVDTEVKGNVTVSHVTKLCPVVIVLGAIDREGIDDNTGKPFRERRMLTRSYQYWPARIDFLLDHQNPGKLPCDLNEVIKLTEGGDNE
jgi:hypothetical protein